MPATHILTGLSMLYLSLAPFIVWMQDMWQKNN